jgi:hypothetical protein
MLLNAYGWWKIGQIALLASIVCFALAVVTLVLSALGVRHYRRVPIDVEIPRVAQVEPMAVKTTVRENGDAAPGRPVRPLV